MLSEVVESRVDIVRAAGAGISWRAILGGAVVMAALGFVLAALGAGFGLSSISPWPGQGASATQFAIIGGVWLIIVQWLSAGIGGYIAGRLGPLSAALHVHERHFRDTARGVIAWAVALVITAVLLASGMSALLGGTARGAASIVAAVGQGAAEGATRGAAQGSSPDMPSGYLVDTLFRKAAPDANGSAQDARGEATRIIASGLANGDLPQADRAYLAQLVAVRTGVSQDDAQKRIDGVIAQARQAEQQIRQAADTARRAARNIAFFIAFSSLIGAFIAGVAGNIGGHHRAALP